MTKFKLQALHIIRINCNPAGSGNPPSFNLPLWNIGNLLHKQATYAKHFESECICFCQYTNQISWEIYREILTRVEQFKSGFKKVLASFCLLFQLLVDNRVWIVWCGDQ